MKNKLSKRRIKRKCLVCGKNIHVAIYRNGSYSNGHYFGVLKLPIKGTGKYIKTGSIRIGRRKVDVVKWSGKEKELEYWECNSCFEQAMHECWLEERIEKLFGKRCRDFEPDCALCQAWDIYDTIRGCSAGKP